MLPIDEWSHVDKYLTDLERSMLSITSKQLSMYKFDNNSSVIIALSQGYTNILDILELKSSTTASYYNTTAIYHQYSSFEWLIENKFRFNFEAIEEAARCGFLRMVVKLKEYGLKINYRVLSAVGIGGDIPTIDYILENYKEEAIDDITIFVAGSGKVETMKWIIEKGYSVTSTASDMAVRSGKLEMVKHLREIGAEFPESICCCCVNIYDKEEALKMLKYLIKEGFIVEEYIISMIATSGNCSMLAYLFEVGYSYPGGMYKSILKKKKYFDERALRTGRGIERDYTEMIEYLEKSGYTG